MESFDEHLVWALIVVFGKTCGKSVFDVIASTESETRGHGGWKQEWKRECVLSYVESQVEIHQIKLAKVWISMVRVNSTMFIISLLPMDLFFSIDYQVQVSVGSIVKTVQVNRSFNHLSCVKDSFIESHVKPSAFVLIDIWAHYII